jgi:hypothetical protein
VIATRVRSLVCAGVLATMPGTASSFAQVVVPLAERSDGAERVVVGRVVSVAPAWRVNEHGDQLIVSMLRVTVAETLKGQAQSTIEVDVEGGSIGDLTLRVSDLPSFTPGERAVFYLRRDAAGRFVPHLRGQGVLKLDPSDRVPGSGLTLDEVRRSVAAALQRQGR